MQGLGELSQRCNTHYSEGGPEEALEAAARRLEEVLESAARGRTEGGAGADGARTEGGAGVGGAREDRRRCWSRRREGGPEETYLRRQRRGRGRSGGEANEREQGAKGAGEVNRRE